LRNLIVIYGCHGAGKTTLAKNILLSDGLDFSEYQNKYGKYTLSQNKKYVAVGKYTINCGGADSLKCTQDYYNMLYELIFNYPKSSIIIEGIFLSGLFNKPLNEFLKIKYQYNINVLQVFLLADTKTSYNRVANRSGRLPNIKNIKGKVNSVKNNIIKFRQLNEFPNVIINTIGKTKEEVYGEFRQFYEKL